MEELYDRDELIECQAMEAVRAAGTNPNQRIKPRNPYESLTFPDEHRQTASQVEWQPGVSGPNEFPVNSRELRAARV